MSLFNTNIKIAILPLDIVWCDYEANIQSIDKILSSLHPDTDILVLPELFCSGFVQDTLLIERLASQYDAAIAAIHNWSEQYNIAIAGSLLAKEGENIYNRGFIVEPSGEETFYDKRHLFCLSPEAHLFSRGTSIPPVIRFRGWNISLIICYDLRFPVWCRNRSNSYDILLVPANWPSSRQYAWEHLMIARAIENQCLVVGANRSGSDDYGVYDNLSFIFDASGHKISTDGQEGRLVYAEYSRDELYKMRKRLPVANDSDRFDINID